MGPTTILYLFFKWKKNLNCIWPPPSSRLAWSFIFTSLPDLWLWIHWMCEYGWHDDVVPPKPRSVPLRPGPNPGPLKAKTRKFVLKNTKATLLNFSGFNFEYSIIFSVFKLQSAQQQQTLFSLELIIFFTVFSSLFNFWGQMKLLKLLLWSCHHWHFLFALRKQRRFGTVFLFYEFLVSPSWFDRSFLVKGYRAILTWDFVTNSEMFWLIINCLQCKQMSSFLVKK